MLVSAKEMLDKAKAGHYAVGQFNINNLEWTKSILLTAQELKSPVILGVSEGAGKYMTGFKTVAAMVKAMDEELGITVPVALHLDHGTYEGCYKCIKAGFTSIMFDGSHYPIEENVEKTKELVAVAHQLGLSIEAEVGSIGGEEDGVVGMGECADPNECKMIADLGVDMLAAGIGNIHGVYPANWQGLSFETLAAVQELTGTMPLVLHGGTGIPADMIKKAIDIGVSKINVNTECQLAFAAATRKYIEEGKDQQGKGFDPRKLLAPGAEAIKATVREKIELPEFVPEKTYSLVFYPIGHDTATQELILVNGAYAVYTSTESAAAELQDCQKDTVTCEDVIDGETYTLYALTDDSGVPSEDNIAYIARKTAEKDQIDFVICPNDDNDMCYVYLSDKTGVLRRVTAINFALKHAYNEKHICTLCGAEDSVAEIILSTLPTKTSYVVDRDMLDVSGGRIMLRYNGGTTEETDLTADMISGFDNTILGKQTLTVTVNNASITFDIEIVEMPVSYVTVEGDKIVLYYNDGITVETSLKEGIVSHFNISETGDKTLTLFSKNACVVAYVNATGDYVRLKASAGEDGSYQYIIPVDITEVTVAVKGDLNSDGQLTVREARQLLRASMDSDFLTKKQFMCADLDGDGSISVREARVLLKASTDSTSITW